MPLRRTAEPREGPDGDRGRQNPAKIQQVIGKRKTIMAKIKTHKAASKRFTLTKSGKVKFNHINRRHQVNLKTSKRMRHLRKAGYLSESMAPTVRSMIR